MRESKELLSKLTSAAGVRAAAVICGDGTLLDRFHIDPEDEDVFSRASLIALRLSESLGSYRDMQAFVQMWIQFEGGLIVVHRICSGRLLFVVADGSAQIGMLRHRLQKAQPELAETYGEVPPVQADEVV
ncbi:MAG: roadblock/LC7 domain-containing protein [Candidatus Latescibacterota bacterium]